MKTIAIIVWLIFSQNCFTQSFKKQVSKNTDISFAEFTKKFNVLELPLDISHLTDFGKYDDKVFKEVNGKTILVVNPLYPEIQINEYKYIKDKYSINKNFHYQSVYKTNFKKYILLVIEQTDRKLGDFFLKLNVYNLSGNLIDTLSLAGQKIDDYDQFCRIDSSLKIKIRRLKDLTQPPQSREPWPNLETIIEYIITDDGHFKQIYYKQQKGLFVRRNNEMIQIDKIK